MKIAIYGKGGIGKSTISANLSAALAHRGKKVLQIGCDPKHDSTRLLLGGKRIVTALDYMRDTPVALQCLDQVLHTGYRGIVCAEAGGPEPGVGCAGRGILSTFALFERLGLNMNSFDVVLYDVLGDVVCGGFAVPLRRGFADVVYVVTSEEFMSIYAANNILKGVKNFDDGGHRLAGIILNSRGKDEDRNSVMRFAGHVNLPIRQTVPRSELFRRAEMMEKTVVEAFPDSHGARVFHELAGDVLENQTFYPARFLNEDYLEGLIFKNKLSSPGKDDCPDIHNSTGSSNSSASLNSLDTPNIPNSQVAMDNHGQTKEKIAGKRSDQISYEIKGDIAFNAESNFKTVEEILLAMNIHVNCRFVRNTSVDRLKNFAKAPLNLAAYTDYFGRLMAEFIDQRLKIPTAPLPFPVGFSESAAWVRMVADFFDRGSKGERLIEAHQHLYEKMLKSHGPALKGKQLMIITYVHNID